MRFLRILPAVWAMISWPFCKRTRKVALGSNSLTVPSNSSNSSLAIDPQLGAVMRRFLAPKGEKIKPEQQLNGGQVEAGLQSFVDFIAHLSISLQPLLPAAFGLDGVRDGPIFHRRFGVPGPFQGMVMRLRRQADHQGEL